MHWKLVVRHQKILSWHLASSNSSLQRMHFWSKVERLRNMYHSVKCQHVPHTYTRTHAHSIPFARATHTHTRVCYCMHVLCVWLFCYCIQLWRLWNYWTSKQNGWGMAWILSTRRINNITITSHQPSTMCWNLTSIIIKKSVCVFSSHIADRK